MPANENLFLSRSECIKFPFEMMTVNVFLWFQQTIDFFSLFFLFFSFFSSLRLASVRTHIALHFVCMIVSRIRCSIQIKYCTEFIICSARLFNCVLCSLTTIQPHYNVHLTQWAADNSNYLLMLNLSSIFFFPKTFIYLWRISNKTFFFHRRSMAAYDTFQEWTLVAVRCHHTY